MEVLVEPSDLLRWKFNRREFEKSEIRRVIIGIFLDVDRERAFLRYGRPARRNRAAPKVGSRSLPSPLTCSDGGTTHAAEAVPYGTVRCTAKAKRDVSTTTPEANDESLPTERQIGVLDAVLRLLVEEGDRLTMTGVARAASCSKETLYKWFGDRDGLLVATVRWQAAQVRVGPIDRSRLDRASLSERLEEFAVNWLTVIGSQTSVALNRVAIGAAAKARGDEIHTLGAIVLENGRFAMGRRLKPVLEAGRDAGLLDFEDAEEAFRTFFGLVARDVQIRLLLGDRIDLSPDTIRRDAGRAVAQFLALHGAERAGSTA